MSESNDQISLDNSKSNYDPGETRKVSLKIVIGSEGKCIFTVPAAHPATEFTYIYYSC